MNTMDEGKLFAFIERLRTAGVVHYEGQLPSGAAVLTQVVLKLMPAPVPAKQRDPLEPAAAMEKAARQKAGRSLDERLLRPLNIGTDS